ncbi:MAG: NUDIX hydrolase [Patescibacteria group bacterium]
MESEHLVGDIGQKALIAHEGKVLMCFGPGHDGWSFPGGRLHKNEDPHEGLHRELKEELGVETLIGDPIHTFVWYGAPSGLPRFFVVYQAALANPSQPMILEEQEIEKIHWVSKDECEQLPMWDGWRQSLRAYFAQK